MLLGLLLILTHCDHVWMEATCSAPRTCEKCGKTEGEPVEHSCIDATCTNPPICRYCITAQGEPLGHDWSAATCLERQTCKRCGATQGHTAAHTFGPSEDGVTKTCTLCGETVTINYVALTFDDGPSGSTTLDLLEGLKERNAKVTFFLCGYRMSQYPGYVEKIAEHGHEIGLHTENHAYLTDISSDRVRSELRNEWNRLPEDVDVRLMRPPGGHFNDTVQSICSSMGLSIIMWSLDTQDWNYDDPNDFINSILGAQNGDIVLMHDIKPSSVEAALMAIDRLQGLGYEFVTVSELAEITGTSLYGGSVYYSM